MCDVCAAHGDRATVGVDIHTQARDSWQRSDIRLWLGTCVVNKIEALLLDEKWIFLGGPDQG